MLFFILTAIISQLALAQPQSGPQPQWNPTFGLIGMEKKRGDKINLVFTHICRGETDGKPEYKHCEKTVEDDDGLASLIAVQAMLKQHYECGSLSPSDTVPNWDYIRPFLISRLDVLVKKCQETACKVKPKGLGKIDGHNGHSVNALKHCGETYKEVQDLKNLLNKPSITYIELNFLSEFLINKENYHSGYKVKTKYGKGRKDETQRERLLAQPQDSNMAQIFNKYATSEADPHGLRFVTQGQGGATTITRELIHNGQSVQAPQHYCYHYNDYESPQNQRQGIAEYVAALTYYYDQDKSRDRNWWRRHRDRLRDRERDYTGKDDTEGGGLPPKIEYFP